MLRLDFDTRYRLALGVAAVVALYAVQAMAPPPIARAPFAETIQMRAFLPEAWHFFTRSPRDPLGEAFRRRSSGELERIGGRASDAGPLGAFVRDRRAVGLEFELVARTLPQGSWVDCTERLEACHSRLRPVAVAAEGVGSLCGDVVLSRTEPVPWSWFSEGDAVEPRRLLARAVVKCGGADA